MYIYIHIYIYIYSLCYIHSAIHAISNWVSNCCNPTSLGQGKGKKKSKSASRRAEPLEGFAPRRTTPTKCKQKSGTKRAHFGVLAMIMFLFLFLSWFFFLFFLFLLLFFFFCGGGGGLSPIAGTSRVCGDVTAFRRPRLSDAIVIILVAELASSTVLQQAWAAVVCRVQRREEGLPFFFSIGSKTCGFSLYTTLLCSRRRILATLAEPAFCMRCFPWTFQAVLFLPCQHLCVCEGQQGHLPWCFRYPSGRD